MKFFAGILITYLVALTVMPAISQFICGKSEAAYCESECSASEYECSTSEDDCSDIPQDKQGKSDCCAYGVFCTICLVYNPQQEAFVFSDVLTAINKKSLTNDNISSRYLSDCWHPPKTV